MWETEQIEKCRLESKHLVHVGGKARSSLVETAPDLDYKVAGSGIHCCYSGMHQWPEREMLVQRFSVNPRVYQMFNILGSFVARPTIRE